jgi:hypothetical protein
MPIRSMKDVVDAVDQGRFHEQRFVKNAGTIGDNQWQDWSFASGQPAFDARIGTALRFTPFVAAGNDAIYFPPIPAGQDRHLIYLDYATTASGTGQTQVEFAVYDLVGVYPLIDGDSGDLQTMANDLAYPRYASGAGVFPVIVNHVAPALGNSDIVVNYRNQSGVSKSVTWAVQANGQNKVCYTTATGGTSGPLYCALAAGDSGVSGIDSVQFTTPPGGLFAIYMCKPVTTFADRSGAIALKATGEKSFALQSAFNMPRILDGAWLGMFYMPVGGARSITMHGNMQFVWG